MNSCLMNLCRFGPLVFGMLMALFENTPVPGAPYLLACILSMWAFLHCFELPPEPELVVAKHRAMSNAAASGEVRSCQLSPLLPHIHLHPTPTLTAHHTHTHIHTYRDDSIMIYHHPVLLSLSPVLYCRVISITRVRRCCLPTRREDSWRS